MKSEPERSMFRTSESAGGSASMTGGSNGMARAGNSAAGCKEGRASTGAASVAAPATTLFRKSRRPAGSFLDLAIGFASVPTPKKTFLILFSDPTGNIRLTAAQCNPWCSLPRARPPGRQHTNQSHHGKRRGRIKCRPVVSVFIEEDSSDGWPKNPREPPSDKQQAIIG